MSDYMNEYESSSQYRPTPALTVLTVIGLVLFALFDLMYIPGGIVGMMGVGVFHDGQRNEELVEISLLIRGVSALGQMLLYIYTPIVLCMLMYRCAKNARALGFTGFSHSPGWVVGWYFIPIAHLIMPYKAIVEVWQSSKAKVEPGVYPEWWDQSAGTLIKAWWAAWIFGTILTNTGSMMSRSVNFETIGMCVIPVAAVLQVLSAILCIMVVLKMTRRQDEQARILFEGSQNLNESTELT